MARKRQPGRGTTTKTRKSKPRTKTATLTPTLAESMHLRTARLYVEGYTFREIADAEGVTVNAINKRLERMRDAGVNLPYRIDATCEVINVEAINAALGLRKQG